MHTHPEILQALARTRVAEAHAHLHRPAARRRPPMSLRLPRLRPSRPAAVLAPDCRRGVLSR